jgi:hypothetical protein
MDKAEGITEALWAGSGRMGLVVAQKKEKP